jgi:molybdenum cofactor biosynthesis protein B
MVDFHERETRTGHDSLDEGALGEDAADGAEATEADHEDRHHADHGDHEHHTHDLEHLRAAVVTVSSTRSPDDDPSGDAIVAAFEAEGHEISTRELVTDDLDGVQGRLHTLVNRDDVDVVVTTGGTGVTPDDVTVEAVRPLFEKELPGFGELFRRRSEAEIGTRTIGSRAVAGIVSATPVFCLPGSENAVRLGVDEIILPEVGHLVGLAGRGVDETGENRILVASGANGFVDRVTCRDLSTRVRDDERDVNGLFVRVLLSPLAVTPEL